MVKENEPDIQALIKALGLTPHPEGGFYAETYRAGDTIGASALPDRYGTDRSASTAIYFLITADSFSAMHRIDSDEIFHFYAGDPVTMLQLDEGGGREITIGNDVLAGLSPQVVVPHGTWQGLRLAEGGRYALLGCTVAPGFDFAGFEMGDGEQLIGEYPEWRDAIRSLVKAG